MGAHVLEFIVDENQSQRSRRLVTEVVTSRCVKFRYPRDGLGPVAV
jgi:hypothetical protein